MKFDPATFWRKGLRTPSPSYSSVEEPVKNGKQFRAFKKGRPTTGVKLTVPENIVDMREWVLATDRDNSQAGRMLMHLVEGSRNSKQFSGFHNLPDPPPRHIENFKIIEPRDQCGVCTLHLLKSARRMGKHFRRKQPHCLRKGWSRQQRYDECLFALNLKIKIEGVSSSYRFPTISGIPLEIHFDKDEKKIRTLYPVWTM